jgi:hypothetical protein
MGLSWEFFCGSLKVNVAIPSTTLPPNSSTQNLSAHGITHSVLAHPNLLAKRSSAFGFGHCGRVLNLFAQ